MGGKFKPRQQRKPKGQTRDMIPQEPKRERKQKRRDNRQDWRQWEPNEG